MSAQKYVTRCAVEAVNIFKVGNGAAGDEPKSRALRERGYPIEPFLSAADIESLLTLHRATKPENPSDFYVSAFADLATRHRVFDGITKVIREKVKILAPGYEIVMASFVNKRARSTQGRLGVHQDYSLVDHAENVGLNVWSPLCDVNERNSCLKVVDGSHLLGHIGATPANPGPYEDVKRELESDRYMAALPMSAGTAVLFDQRVLHGTEDNLTDADRTAILLSLGPENIAPLLYMWNEQDPGKLEVYEITTEVLLQLPPNRYFENVSRLGAKFVRLIDHTFDHLTSADLQKRLPALRPKEMPAGDPFPV